MHPCTDHKECARVVDQQGKGRPSVHFEMDSLQIQVVDCVGIVWKKGIGSSMDRRECPLATPVIEVHEEEASISRDRARAERN